MAAYNTRTKIWILNVDASLDTVTNSTAKTINDYVQTLDETTGQILFFEIVPVSNTKVMVTMIHKG